MEAQANGYVEAIALSPDGMVSEGSGQNVFVVRDGALCTPPIGGSNLSGLTRGSPVPREALYRKREVGAAAGGARSHGYVADELFFTGTATEVMPI
eukprot:gene7954-2917_t